MKIKSKADGHKIKKGQVWIHNESCQLFSVEYANWPNDDNFVIKTERKIPKGTEQRIDDINYFIQEGHVTYIGKF